MIGKFSICGSGFFQGDRKPGFNRWGFDCLMISGLSGAIEPRDCDPGQDDTTVANLQHAVDGLHVRAEVQASAMAKTRLYNGTGSQPFKKP